MWVVIASVVGIAIMFPLLAEYDGYSRKIKMPPSFWAYVAWCALICLVRFFVWG